MIEYEFAEPIQCGLFIGDSNSVTFGSASQGTTNSGAGALSHESWPMVAGSMGGFAATNLGVGPSSTPDWQITYPYLWDRVDLASVDIDFTVISLGTNNGSAGLVAFVPAVRAIHTKLRDTFGIKRTFWTTITPRGCTTLLTRTTAATAPGVTSITLDAAPANGSITIGSGFNMENVTVSASSGSGPCTATVGATAQAHAAGEPVSCGAEQA